jgi:hypothetical protein
MTKRITNLICLSKIRFTEKFKRIVKEWSLISLIFSILKKIREWSERSYLNYTIVVLCGLVWISLLRLLAVWTTNTWHYLPIYYLSTFILMGLSFFAVSVRYMKHKGYLQRFELNKQKWNSYTELVAEKYNLKWNFKLSKSFIFFLCVECLFTNFYRDNRIGETFSNLLNFAFVLLFFLLFINQIYIYLCMKETPIPIKFVGEPPGFI